MHGLSIAVGEAQAGRRLYNQAMVLLIAILGGFVGMGINLLADSLPTMRNVQGVHCRACGGPVEPVQISALVALIAGRQRCGHCGTPRSHRSWLVEAAAILVSVLLYLFEPDATSLLTAAVILSLYGLIAVIDIEHRLILHMVSIPTIVLIALLRGLDPAFGWSKTAWGGAAGLGFMLMFYFAGELFSRWMARRRGVPIDEVAFGFGDVLLGCAVGLDVGWPGVVIALFAGIFAAGLYSLALILVRVVRRDYKAFLAIPYGPFLIFGAVWLQYGGKTLLQALFQG